MAPSIIWGIGVGLIIAAVDAAAVFLGERVDPTQWPIGDVDLLVNIALYSFIGFRVGRTTGTVRDAAEAGVLAGVIVGLIGLAVALGFPRPAADPITTRDIVEQIASNVVYGGCLAIVSGWFGSRASKGGSAARR